MGGYAARVVGSILAGASLALTGCVPPVPEGFASPDPNRRLSAISDAGERADESAIPDLIEQLESNDPGARLLAIRALEKITGQTLGYDHADPWWARAAAVRRWRDWARAHADTAAPPSEGG